MSATSRSFAASLEHFYSADGTFPGGQSFTEMRLTILLSVSLLSAAFGCALACRLRRMWHRPIRPPARAANSDADPVPLDWVPPALAQLSLRGAGEVRLHPRPNHAWRCGRVGSGQRRSDATGDQQAGRRQRAHHALSTKQGFLTKERLRRFAPRTICADGSTS